MDPWTYRALHPELSENFDRAMTDTARRITQSILSAFDFGRFATIADIGGGHGALLAAILAKHPDTQGILFDMPHVVAGADQLLQSSGVADRCRIVGGSFFEAVPEADACILKSVLHDWNDEQAITILRTCRQAMTPGGTLLVIENRLDPPNEGAAGQFSDLNMLVANGGEERTSEEFAILFDTAGFRLVDTFPAGEAMVIIEGAAI
jgi:16S rRNA G1207 methylase RsmC